MLNRLRLTQRLSLLLVLPLVAVVLSSVPFTVERVDDARAAGAIVSSAHNARLVGAIIQELQQERLLALGYLATPRLHRGTLVAQMESTVDAGVRAQAGLRQPFPAGLDATLADLAKLDEVRQGVLRRGATLAGVYATYHNAVIGLVNGLRLDDQPGTDATGLRQMSSLDALLRTNEEANQIGAALIVATADPAVARSLIAGARQLEQVYLEQFRQAGNPSHVEVLALGAQGPSAKRAAGLVAVVSRGGELATTVAVEDSLSAAQSVIDIRRSVQDGIAREVASTAVARATGAKAAAAVVGGFAAGLLVLVIWLGVAVSRSVARPLRRVTLAAVAVADLASRELVRVSDDEAEDRRPPKLAALTIQSADEVGELASAFNRVQATAALLMEQQITTRHNVAVMFGNIAHRTRSLVARQLARIDELERDESDEHRLTQLYRLDHLSTRLRRSADSLLVIAGYRDEARLASPTVLVDVVRSAIAEVEGYQNVQLGAICEVTVAASAVPDLTLLLAELLENATSFSPPDTPVQISASLRSECLIHVVDHGIGMSPERLADENRRMVSRERLDIAPTTMLGLFVVGRLARRHGITVRLVPSAVTGVTAEIAVPPELLMWEGLRAARETLALPGATPPPPPRGIATPRQAVAMHPDGPARPNEPPPTREFTWFDRDSADALASLQAANGYKTAHQEAGRAGLRRRQPGASLSNVDLPAKTVPPDEGHMLRDPEAERAGLNAFAQGVARAGSQDQGFDRTRAGLHRRQPGENLSEYLRHEVSGASAGGPVMGQKWAPGSARDPEAERSALDGYLDGLARAADPTLNRDPNRSRP